MIDYSLYYKMVWMKKRLTTKLGQSFFSMRAYILEELPDNIWERTIAIRLLQQHWYYFNFNISRLDYPNRSRKTAMIVYREMCQSLLILKNIVQLIPLRNFEAIFQLLKRVPESSYGMRTQDEFLQFFRHLSPEWQRRTRIKVKFKRGVSYSFWLPLLYYSGRRYSLPPL